MMWSDSRRWLPPPQSLPPRPAPEWTVAVISAAPSVPAGRAETSTGGWGVGSATATGDAGETVSAAAADQVARPSEVAALVETAGVIRELSGLRAVPMLVEIDKAEQFAGVLKALPVEGVRSW